MKVEFNKKYTTISVYTIITFAVCLLLVVLVNNAPIIAGYIKKIAKVLAPITWGIVISYIINPVMVYTEGLLKRLIDRKKPHPKLTRTLSVAISMILLVALLTAIIAILLPQVIESVMGIASNFSSYITTIENWVYKFFADYPDIVEYFNNQFDSIQPKLIEYVNNLMPQLANLAVKVKDGAILFVVGLKDFIIGFIVALYLLFSKEKFIAQMRKCIKAVFPKGAARSIFAVASHTNKTLSGFLSGKIIDSFIIGVITFISMTIMDMEFVALISVVIGVTNIIPFFGPIIGAIPSAFLLLLAAPKQVIPFIIFIVILQQFDGNILGPKILGDSTGLSPFWVMFAIFVGGGLFGFAGMLLGVPVFAVIYALVSDFINFLLSSKNMSTATADYYARDAVIPAESGSTSKFFNFKKKTPEVTEEPAENAKPEETKETETVKKN